ncbi:MAG TPA: hypothetical protein VF600_13420 [Abditibacteriaceae bacterium]|jgi:hypothetical protein
MNYKLSRCLLLAAILGLMPASARGENLLNFDFNGTNPWPEAAADVMPSTPLDILTTLEVRAVGTAAAAEPDKPTGGLLIGAEVGEVALNWSAIFTSGFLAIKNSETDLKRLKLGLNLSASAAHPVRLQMESFNAKKQRSGGLETVLEPRAADSYERFNLDLSAFKPLGAGKFVPTDAFVQFTFIIEAPAWTDKALHQIRIDDLSLANSQPVAPAPIAPAAGFERK